MERSRSGTIEVAGKEYRVTVTLSLTRTPPSPVRRQDVRVDFHGDSPSQALIVAENGVTFREETGTEYVLDYSGRRWYLRNAAGFLEDP